MAALMLKGGVLSLALAFFCGAALAEGDGLFTPRPGKLRLIPGSFVDGGVSHFAHVDGGFNLEPGGPWRGEFAARLDAWNDAPESKVRADLDALFVQWRGEAHRFSLGYQTARWGKTDEISPVDRVVGEDWTRPFEDLAERRRALPMLRYEWFGEDQGLDLVLRPWLREARMPRLDSAWSPIDQKNGRLLGIAPPAAFAPGMQAAVQAGQFVDDADGSAGWGLRYSANRKGLDWAVSAQHWRRSSPYYEMIPGLPPRFEGRHPYSRILGGELSAALGAITTRAEIAYLSDEPVTAIRGATLAYTTVPAYEAVAGIDWWPGDKDTLVVIQLAGRQLDDQGETLLDRTHALALNGSVRTEWGRGNWQARLRYSFGLDSRDNYLNPALTWLGWDGQQVTLGGHWFSGEDATPGGYYANNDFVYLEWRLDF